MVGFKMGNKVVLKLDPGQREEIGFGVAATTFVEYLAIEVLETAAGKAKDAQNAEVRPWHIVETVFSDDALLFFFQDKMRFNEFPAPNVQAWSMVFEKTEG